MDFPFGTQEFVCKSAKLIVLLIFLLIFYSKFTSIELLLCYSFYYLFVRLCLLVPVNSSGSHHPFSLTVSASVWGPIMKRAMQCTVSRSDSRKRQKVQLLN